jgi:AAA+ ATPase superfamily predicted ATPase
VSVFIGRTADLARLAAHLDRVRTTGQGTFLSVRGRRQVGKSRLIEEFLARSGVASVFFVASRQRDDEELAAFRAAVAASSTAAASMAAEEDIGGWEAALTLLASEATTAGPIVIVLDELPYLIASNPAIEAILQKVWDRVLERRPVLVIAIGSDISTMEMLTGYGRPLYGRVTEMRVEPLTPAEVADMLSLDPVSALDAYVVLGGFPRLAARWAAGESVDAFLARELADSESPLVVLGERAIAGEFPDRLAALQVAHAIGAGERAFTAIQVRAGVAGRSLTIALKALEDDKRIVRRSVPYSAEVRPKLARYTIADPYLRFWLRFLADQLPLLQRGRSDVVLERVRTAWPSYRGKAIEPVVQSAIERLLPDDRFGDARFVGGFWNRDGTVEVDLVGGRDTPTTASVAFVGSIKWLERQPFGRHDLAALIVHRLAVPGASPGSLLVGVSRSGFDVDGLDVRLGPTEIVDAFR